MLRDPVISLRTFLFLYNSAGTILISFLPIYYQSLGLSGSEIGWLLAVGPFVALLIQPVAGFLSDKWKTVKKLMIISIIGVILGAIILFSLNSFILLLLTSLIFFSFMSPLGALGDSLAQKTAKHFGVAFGSIRMWGSVGFGLSALLTGQLLFRIGVENILYPFLFFAIGTLIVSFFISDVTTSSRAVGLLDALSLLKNTKLTLFMAVTMFISLPHRMNDSYFGIYMKQIGGNESLIGWAWFIATVVEALIFFISTNWFKRFKELNLIIVIALVYGIRYISMGLIDNPVFILFLQPLHGITFAILYTAAIQYVSRIVPEHILGTAHLLFISVFFGISGMVGSLLGGWILETFNGSVLYWTMGTMAIIGSGAVFVYKTFQKD